MDPRLRGFSGSLNGIQSGNLPSPVVPNRGLLSGPQVAGTQVNQSLGEFDHFVPMARPSIRVPDEATGEDLDEDCEFSGTVLSYINQILMEEDVEDRNCLLQNSLDLQAAEKPFYEVLGKKYPPSPEPIHGCFNQNEENLRNNLPIGFSYTNAVGYGNGSGYLDDIIWNHKQHSVGVNSKSQSSYSSPSSAATSVDGLVDSPQSTFDVPDWNIESQPILQFRKGVEEASKFLPSCGRYLLGFEPNGPPKEKTGEVAANFGKKEVDIMAGGYRGKKNPHPGDTEEERSSKHRAFSVESSLPPEVFDRVLLYTTDEGLNDLSSLRESMISMSIKNEHNGRTKVSAGGKGRGMKSSRKKEVVDLRTLLISCAQSVSADDRKSANELLRQIRQHSSAFGDGNQRLAHCLADGLEARLAGMGSQIYKGLVGKRTSAGDVLKAYHLYLAACPFRKLSNYVSNVTIRKISETSNKLHVIDFGILYGFQWPTLIQRLSMQPGGPPSLRITGIEFPQPGFRPAQGVEDTGRRLTVYAKKFNVPFEYNAIAKKWESITLEELKLEKDEKTIVTCLYRTKNLLDETVSVDCPRNIVLSFIRKIKPEVFIHGVVNGAFNAPFFVTRFREALFHFSAMFDMLETIVPRHDPERLLIEKEIFGREALNAIACEGWERVERPETYKQWRVRCMRAGFTQVAFDRDVVLRARTKVKTLYHKDFLVDEDNKWLLQGWKGRIIFTLSAWKPS